MALSKVKKKEIVEQYDAWMEKSVAFFLTEYLGMKVNDLDNLRLNIREAGGEFHIVKNTLIKRLFVEKKLEFKDEQLVNTTAIGFAFDDPPALAKALTDFAKESDFLKIKSGYLDNRYMSPEEVIALANVPPLPIVRGQLLSTLLAPASQFVRILTEPGRQIAAVLNAFSESGTAPESV